MYKILRWGVVVMLLLFNFFMVYLDLKDLNAGKLGSQDGYGYSSGATKNGSSGGGVGSSSAEITAFGESFSGFSEKFAEVVREKLDAEPAGLALGYALGLKTEISSDLKNKIQTVGLSHIIVVSGTHLAIMVGFVRKIFGHVSRLATVYFSIAFLAFYCAMVGLSPSLLRASVVTVLSLIGWYFGRKLSTFRKILYCLTICLLIDRTLLFSVSFQLSMSAYIGILVILPGLTRFFYGGYEKIEGLKKPGIIATTLLASVSASLACLPVQLYYFGSFSFLALISNILILPTISVTLGLVFVVGVFGIIGAVFSSGIMAIIGSIFDFLSTGVAFFANLVLNYQIKIVEFLADKTEFLLEIPKKNPGVLIIYGVILAGLSVYIWSEKGKFRKEAEDFKNLEKLNIWE